MHAVGSMRPQVFWGPCIAVLYMDDATVATRVLLFFNTVEAQDLRPGL